MSKINPFKVRPTQENGLVNIDVGIQDLTIPQNKQMGSDTSAFLLKEVKNKKPRTKSGKPSTKKRAVTASRGRQEMA